MYIIILNFAAIDVKRYSDLTVFKMVAFHHCYRFEILSAETVRRVNVRHRAKFHADSGGMVVFRLFKMAVVRHLRCLEIRNCTCRCISEGQYVSPRLKK